MSAITKSRDYSSAKLSGHGRFSARVVSARQSETHFPRYVKTTDLTIRTGELIGPIEDKHAANRLIELVESCFDLCRYYNILVESPNGKACAYKEMGKCPAPCDGSISIEQYRRMIEWSAKVLADPAEYIREQTRRMQSAAAELRFETASKIKAYIDELSQLAKGRIGTWLDWWIFNFCVSSAGRARGP